MDFHNPSHVLETLALNPCSHCQELTLLKTIASATNHSVTVVSNLQYHFYILNCSLVSSWNSIYYIYESMSFRVHFLDWCWLKSGQGVLYLGWSFLLISQRLKSAVAVKFSTEALRQERWATGRRCPAILLETLPQMLKFPTGSLPIIDFCSGGRSRGGGDDHDDNTNQKTIFKTSSFLRSEQ